MFIPSHIQKKKGKRRRRRKKRRRKTDRVYHFMRIWESCMNSWLLRTGFSFQQANCRFKHARTSVRLGSLTPDLPQHRCWLSCGLVLHLWIAARTCDRPTCEFFERWDERWDALKDFAGHRKHETCTSHSLGRSFNMSSSTQAVANGFLFPLLTKWKPRNLPSQRPSGHLNCKLVSTEAATDKRKSAIETVP